MKAILITNVRFKVKRKSKKRNEGTLKTYSLHGLSSNLLIRFFSLKRVAVFI